MVLVGVLGLIGAGPSATASTGSTEPPQASPTVVLVHGSFADASGFNDVVQRLQALDYTTIAPPNPLRTVAGDAAYIRNVLDSIDGPIVLVAHSYGGMVITNAATGHPGVNALVYINGFAPAEGEMAGELVMAATQRPLDLATLEQPSGPPAWETIPSWFIIGTEDNTFRLSYIGSWPSAPAQSRPSS
jgi:pimeloyl-ACP methyl ester carboxylesterase